MHSKKLSRIAGSACVALVMLATLAVACSQPAPSPGPSPAAPAAKPSPSPTVAQPIILKYADSDPISAVGPKNAYEPVFNQLEQRSGGRLKVERYYSGTLLPIEQLYEGVLSGVADVAKARQVSGGRFQLIAIGGMPYAAKDNRNIIRALNALVVKGYMDADLQGLHFLYAGGTAPYSFLFKNKKPMTLDEVRGLKVRTPGGYLGSVLKAANIVGVTLTPGETYDAVAKGIVDGVMWSRSSFVDFRINELSKYLLVNDASIFTSQIFVINQKKYDSLPKDLQALVDDELGQKLAILYLEVFNKNEIPAEETIRKGGIEVYSWPQAEVDKMRKAILPVWEEGVSDLNKKGLNGKQIMTEYVNLLKGMGENPPWSP